MRAPKLLVGAGALQTIAIAGGKGGVGKTTVAVNLATALAAQGRRTLLLDGDLGLANVDVLLGITPRYTLSHVFNGERSLDEIVIDTELGFSVIPGASGIAKLAALGESQHVGLVRAFASLQERFDVLLVDTAPGISPAVLQFAQAAQEVLLVVCDEPTSLTDSYAQIKILRRTHGVTRFKVLVNMSRSSGCGSAVFQTLERVTSRFLEVVLEYGGEVPEDPLLRKSIREQRPVITCFPSSPAARALKVFAHRVGHWPVVSRPRGNIEFFAERLLQRAPPRLEVVR